MESTCQDVQMPDRHRRPAVLGRPEPEVKAQLDEVLKANGWTVDQFVVAATAWVLEDPRRLADLAPLRPDERPLGRPPKVPKS